MKFQRITLNFYRFWLTQLVKIVKFIKYPFENDSF